MAATWALLAKGAVEGRTAASPSAARPLAWRAALCHARSKTRSCLRTAAALEAHLQLYALMWMLSRLQRCRKQRCRRIWHILAFRFLSPASLPCLF